MRKIVLKTALVTLGVVIVLAVAAFGIASLCIPATMSELTYSLGMDLISSDYAYQEYERSGDTVYLARAFEICATEGYDDKTADDRFGLLYEDRDAFAALCEKRNGQVAEEVGVRYDYRGYVVGLGACVKYRLAGDDAERAAAIELALSETDASFPAGNPVIALAVEAAGRNDAAFCNQLLTAVQAGNFEETTDYINIVKILEGIANE